MLADRFEIAAERFRKRPALKVPGTAPVSYAELNRQANRIAHASAARTDRGGVPIALLTGEIRATVAAILGVLKSGNVCIPLDPGLPARRLAKILEHAGAELILTTAATDAIAAGVAGGATERIVVDALDPALAETNPGLRLTAETLAAILYTSGSTGAPKGVVHDHLNLAHSAEHWSKHFGFGPRDRGLQLAPITHVTALNDILKLLLAGACVVPFRLTESSLTRLAAVIRDERITLYHSIPSIFRSLAGVCCADHEPFSDLRLVHLGGEPVFRTDVELFRRSCPADCVLINNLGSTEIPTYVQHVVDATSSHDGALVPIGRPVPGKEILLLDETGRAVRDGEIGEIVVRSAYLARGYWRDPERTAATFSGDPTRRAERTYRTGDLGRRNAEGLLEYLGRRDDQIKVRGHRVELGEVQFALAESARDVGNIVETTVAPRLLSTGVVGLVAYVASRAGARVDLGRLRARVSQSLPAPMRPEHYVVLERIPRTATGKIDRVALPPPDRTGRCAAPGQPRSPVARQLAELWTQLLRVGSVSGDADFFELGGDSLLALELAGEIEKLFGRRLSLPEILRRPTLDAMASAIAEHAERQSQPCVVPFKTDGTKTPLWLVHGLGGAVVQMRELARVLDSERPVYAVQACGVDDLTPALGRVESMAERYLMELRAIQPRGPYLIAGYSMGGVVAFEMAQQLVGRGAEVGALILIDSAAPLPLGLRDRLVFSSLFATLFARRMLGRAMGGRGNGDAREIDRVTFANFRATRRYRPCPYRGPIHLLSSTDLSEAGAEGRSVRERRLARRLARHLRLKRDLWSRLTTTGLNVIDVPGHHLRLFSPPALDGLVSRLRLVLAEWDHASRDPAR